MFDHRHYVPILKSKQGEMWALAHLSHAAKSAVTPLLELDTIPRPAKSTKKPAPKKPKPPSTLATHLAKKCIGISKAWGTRDQFFADMCWLKVVDAKTVDAIFAAMRDAALKVVPVVRVSDSTLVLNAVSDVLLKDKRGVMLRVSPRDLMAPHLIDATIKELRVNPPQVHLLLDYGTTPMALAVDLGKIPYLKSWITLSAASSSFPPSLKGLSQKKWHDIARDDVMSWKKGLRAATGRLPAFSDYSVRAPGAPPSGGNPPVVVRYTCDKKWIARQDCYHMDGDSPEMKTICQSLIRRPEFCGEKFSAGDREFKRIADGAIGTGGPTNWVQYAVNHHIEFVVANDLP